MARAFVAIGLMAALAVPTRAAQQQERAGGQQRERPGAAARQQGADQFVGEYTVASCKEGGQEQPAEQKKDWRVRITEDRMTFLNAEGQELFVVEYRIEGPAQIRGEQGRQAATEPNREEGRARGQAHRIMMKTVRVHPEAQAEGDAPAEGETARGLIMADGETVKLVCAKGESEQYPEDFEAEDEDQTLFVLQKQGEGRGEPGARRPDQGADAPASRGRNAPEPADARSVTARGRRPPAGPGRSFPPGPGGGIRDCRLQIVEK